MGFQLPEYVQTYLNNEWRTPPQSFVNSSQYYANVDPYLMQYMRTVVRPCLAYSNGTADGTINSGLRMNIGRTIKDTAVRIIKGERVLFEGDDRASKIISDKWSPSVNFYGFYETAIDYMLSGGSTLVKLNKDRNGRCVPIAVRADRYFASTDEEGNVLRATILNTFIMSQKVGNNEHSYWLVEERFFEGGTPYVRYKINLKSGIAGTENLPTLEGEGIPLKDLPDTAQRAVRARGIKLNQKSKLPFFNGLGCKIWRRTQTNSTVPGLAMGDPLLFGALDLLWACDVVFSGSLTDVLLGKGKILVPKKYLQSIRDDLKAIGISDKISARLARTDALNDGDDAMVYVYTEHDKDFLPKEVQFDIRSEKYNGMLEMYLRQICSLCGFAPTSIFPFLVDGSQKTATEVTAEENLTRGTVQCIHQQLAQYINELLDEVLYQLYMSAGLVYKSGSVTVKLSDYIGNPLQRDRNIRDNYMAGLLPREKAVQLINDLTAAETEEYMSKIAEDDKQKQSQQQNFGGLWNDSNYFGDNPNEGGGIT